MHVIVLCGAEPRKDVEYPSPLTMIHGTHAIYYVLEHVHEKHITFVVSDHLRPYNFSNTVKFLHRDRRCHILETDAVSVTEMARVAIQSIQDKDSVLVLDARYIQTSIPPIQSIIVGKGLWGFPCVEELYMGTILEDMEQTYTSVTYPIQIKEQAVEAVKHIKPHKLRICFDLDNTLVTPPSIPRDYTTVEPIPHMISLVQRLKREGHTIIIHTARKMLTHGHNLGAAMASVGKLTFETLDRFEIPYDELLFGKPYADLYIDDKAYNQYTTPLSVIGFPDLFKRGISLS